MSMTTTATAWVSDDLYEQVIARTLRLPLTETQPGDGQAAARRLDGALLSVGFKCSAELFAALAAMDEASVNRHGARLLSAVRQLVGAHVQHNPYFIRFPEGTPDTETFWLSCIREALADPGVSEDIELQVGAGTVNLLDLPAYGRYQHSYAEMVAHHSELVASIKDRVTVVHLGGALEEETHALYLSLAQSPTPLSDADRSLLATLAALHAPDAQPQSIPVRENRALINMVRLRAAQPLLIDTVTDVLRLACALSDGDVTLETRTRLRSFKRSERRALLGALDRALAGAEAKLGDVAKHAEPFKRLGERLHPHEYSQFPQAQDLFAVARGERKVMSLAARAEAAFAAGDNGEAISVLLSAPGMLARSADRLLRSGADPVLLADALSSVAEKISTRVLLSLREHLANRDSADSARIFIGRSGRAHVAPDLRAPLADAQPGPLRAVLDAEIARRLALPAHRADGAPLPVVITDEAADVALPLSGKARPDGIGLLPRGSVQALDGEHLRFFIYWREAVRRTDYDLSVLLLDENFQTAGWVSYTALTGAGINHSGDIVQARDGASEFIDVELASVAANVAYIVPQVNVYSGEGFDTAAEAFFGFMTRDASQLGLPFEPRTVRAKSDLSGSGRVALPLVFARTASGWEAKWMHLNLRGEPHFNQVENNRLSASQLVRSIVERDYLTVRYLGALLAAEHGSARTEEPQDEPAIIFVTETPVGLADRSIVYTPQNLPELFA